MDINIEAPKHENQEALKAHYTKVLTKKYSKYPFVKQIKLRVVKEITGTRTAMHVEVEKDKTLYAEAIDHNEHKASYLCNKKISRQIEKYKEKHYHKLSKTK